MTGANDNEPRGGPKGPIKDVLRPPLPKRFYSEVALKETDSGRYEVLLDGRCVRTPLKRILHVGDRAFAERVLNEWQAQVGVVDPATMPATRLANSAIDTVADHRPEVAGEVVAYAGSDLLCYRATSPQSLVERQSEVWDPILAAVEADLAVRFARTQGVLHVPQSEAALEQLRASIADLPDLPLAGLQLITTLTGSAILAVALLRGLATADAVWAAAHVDEDWQIALWGRDEEAEVRRALRENDYRAAAAALATMR